MHTFQDFLIYYNKIYVTGFLHAVHKQRDFLRARGMTFLEDALSLPGLSLELLFQLKIRTLAFLFCSITNTQTYTLRSNKILWVARPLFGTDWPSKLKQKFALMIILMPKQLKQTWDMILPRCIYIAWGKTCPLAILSLTARGVQF